MMGLSSTSFIISIFAVLYMGISTMKLTRPALPSAYKGTSCHADLIRPPPSVRYSLKVLVPYLPSWVTPEDATNGLTFMTA